MNNLISKNLLAFFTDRHSFMILDQNSFSITQRTLRTLRWTTMKVTLITYFLKGVLSDRFTIIIINLNNFEIFFRPLAT